MQLKNEFSRNSVTVRSLALMILLSVIILLIMEIVGFYIITVYYRQTVENYRNSLEMYLNSWDRKLVNVNNSLVMLTSVNNTDVYYRDVCSSANQLEIQTGKTMLFKKLTEIAWMNDNNIMIFVYVPDKNVYIKSPNNLAEQQGRERMDNDIMEYVKQSKRNNSIKWTYLQSDNQHYLMNIFYSQGGYAGAIVKCDSVLEKLAQEESVVSNTVLLDDEGGIIYSLKQQDGSSTTDFQISMAHVSGKLIISVSEDNIFSDRAYFAALFVGTIVIGLCLLLWNIRFQLKFVLGPLNRLKNAMLEFSHGNWKVRLKDNNQSDEVNILFRTFNYMAEQIEKLKIQIYESKLEGERIKSNYMRVQIQPHFYTNVLNLIYGLAQMRDYQNIQKITMTTGAYFRYLLSEKGSFVLIKEEVNCTKNYLETQKIRYEGCLEYEIIVEEGLEDQLVIPLVLQTFAENSVKHNITIVQNLFIKISITKRGNMLIIVIEDNGVGFERDIIEKIFINDSISKDGEHIGIQNVKERLKLLYSETASVNIDSRPGATKVCVMMPIIVPEEPL